MLLDLLIYYYAGLHDVISPLTRDQLMRRTYQIPGRVCFTRNFKTHLKKGDLITMESFRIRLAHVAVQIFIHYPGETLRKVFGMDRIYKAALTMTKQQLDSSNRYEIKLSQMTVLKKRPDGLIHAILIQVMMKGFGRRFLHVSVACHHTGKSLLQQTQSC